MCEVTTASLPHLRPDGQCDARQARATKDDGYCLLTDVEVGMPACSWQRSWLAGGAVNQSDGGAQDAAVCNASRRSRKNPLVGQRLDDASMSDGRDSEIERPRGGYIK